MPTTRRSLCSVLLLALCALALASCARGKLGSVPPGGGGGGGGGGTVPPPPRATRPPFLPGLLGLAAGPGSIRADFELPGTGYEAALFVGTDRRTLFGAAPAVEPLTGRSAIVDRLVDGTEHFVGIGVRTDGGAAYVPSGPVLRAVPGTPIFVDAAADPAVANGQSPQTAYADLADALLAAVFQGGGNVWVRDGEYATGSALVFPGTHVYGGFGAAFDLASREATAGRTIVHGTVGQQVLAVAGGAPAAVIDGLRLEGGGTFPIGIDVDNSPVEIRETTVRGFAGRGVRIRNSSSSDVIDIVVTASDLSGNGGDGLSADGPFDLRMFGSTLDANVQEGLDLDDLVAPDGETARLDVIGCRFFGNGAEGLDVDLAAPAVPGPTPGRFRVAVRACRFEANALAGLFVDADYEAAPGWSADVVIRECLSRQNRGDGFQVDADGPGTVALHRVLATANGADGVLITSESDAGLATVSSSVAAANGGAGFRASLGNKPIANSHCVASGNRGGGFVSDTVESSTVSGVTHLQLEPQRGFVSFGSVDVTDPGVASFRWVPIGFGEVAARDGATLTLATPLQVEVEDPIELGDDGVLRRVQEVNGTVLAVDPEPDVFLVPGAIAVFAREGQHVVEDYRLAERSVLAGRGYAAAGADPVDPGPFGAPTPGEPGVPDLVDVGLLLLRDSTPHAVTGVTANEPIELQFSSALDPGSLQSTSIRVVTSGGSELAVTPDITGPSLRIEPPAGGWGGRPFRVEVFAGLRDTDGHDLANPLVLPFRIR